MELSREEGQEGLGTPIGGCHDIGERLDAIEDGKEGRRIPSPKDLVSGSFRHRGVEQSRLISRPGERQQFGLSKVRGWVESFSSFLPRARFQSPEREANEEKGGKERIFSAGLSAVLFPPLSPFPLFFLSPLSSPSRPWDSREKHGIKERGRRRGPFSLPPPLAPALAMAPLPSSQG